MRHILPERGRRGRSERRQAMARADTASASLRSDSIKGLAQSIAKPAYRRLLMPTALRRAVPVLIIAFLPLSASARGAGARTAPPDRHRRPAGDRGAGRPARFGARSPGARCPRDHGAHRRCARARAAAMGGAGRPAGARGRCRRHHRRQRAERPADDRAPGARRARTGAAADHLRRRRRHARDHAARRRRRLRHRAGAQEPARPGRRH